MWRGDAWTSRRPKGAHANGFHGLEERRKWGERPDGGGEVQRANADRAADREDAIRQSSGAP